MGSALSADGGESGRQGALDSLPEHVGAGEVLESISALPDTVCSGTLSVDDSLGDSTRVSANPLWIRD